MLKTPMAMICNVYIVPTKEGDVYPICVEATNEKNVEPTVLHTTAFDVYKLIKTAWIYL
jgi:hypothetical protein